MKKTIAIILALVTILALAGCGVASRQYRRYSYNTPATDYATDYTLDGANTGIYNDNTGVRTRNNVNAYPRTGRSYTGGTTMDGFANTRTRMLNPGDAPLYDNTITRSGTTTHTGVRTPARLNDTTLNDKMSRAAS